MNPINVIMEHKPISLGDEAGGGTPGGRRGVQDIPNMSREGVLEDFSDAGQGKAPGQSM